MVHSPWTWTGHKKWKFLLLITDAFSGIFQGKNADCFADISGSK